MAWIFATLPRAYSLEYCLPPPWSSSAHYTPIYRCFLLLAGVCLPGALENACTFGNHSLLHDISVLAPMELTKYDYNPFPHMCAARSGSEQCLELVMSLIPLTDDQVFTVQHCIQLKDVPYSTKGLESLLEIQRLQDVCTRAILEAGHVHGSRFNRLQQFQDLVIQGKQVVSLTGKQPYALFRDWIVASSAQHDAIPDEDMTFLWSHHYPEIEWV
jgi:hypothetical protein